jgi:hypothetical protein
MNPSLYDQITREHPAYVAGFAQGRDVGLRMALEVVPAESARQDDAAIVAALDPRQHVDTARHRYCAGRLLAVGRIVAGQFRQLTHE